GISSWSGPAPGPATPTSLVLVDDRDAHGPRGTGDNLDSGVDVVGVEVFALALGDGAELLAADLGDLGLVRLGGALGDSGRLEQNHRRGGVLEPEVEGASLKDRDPRRHYLAAVVLRRGVVGLAELHDVQAVRTQRLPNRGRVRGARLQCELH